MTQGKKDFIEAMLTWFRSPKVGKDEELDRRFLASAYDNITQPHWISVEDELPKEKGWIIVSTFFNSFACPAYYYEGEDVEVFRSEGITHWMPEAPLVTDLNKKDLPPVSWQEGNILVEEEGGEKMDFFTWKERYEYYRTKGYEQGYEDANNKACEWIGENMNDVGIRFMRGDEIKDIVDLFRKAMKGGKE